MSQDIQHNGAKWRVCRNRHTTAEGRDWGWIEGPSKNVCWEDGTAFDRYAAEKVANDHNTWLEQQKSVTLRLIEANEKLSTVNERLADAESKVDAIKSEKNKIEQFIVQLNRGENP